VAIVVGIVAAAVVLWPVTIVPSGSSWVISGANYQTDGPWTMRFASTITGTFTADNGITAYIMNMTEFQNWSQRAGQDGYAAMVGYYWTSGSVTSESVDTRLAAGTYIWIFDFPSAPPAYTGVMVTSAIQATVW